MQSNLSTKVLLDLFVSLFWTNHACYLRGANSDSVFHSCWDIYSWDFVALNPTKLGFHSIQKYFLSLISWVLLWILVCPCSVTEETLLLSLMLQRSLRRDGGETSRVQMLSMRLRREEHPVRRPQTYGLKRRTPLELLAFSLGTEAHCPSPALRAT